MSDKYSNPNNLAKVCSYLAETTGNERLDDLAVILSAHEASFNTIIYEPAMKMAQDQSLISQAVPEA
ncbi:MAG: hypothetical protein IJW32_01725 [Clostridia bacterium]|nr:hypothetical protein [Clostridia bacterium]